MDIILVALTYLILLGVIAFLIFLLDQEKQRTLDLEKQYLEKFKDLSDKIYFRKPEEFVQNKAVEKDESQPFITEEGERMMPLEDAPMEEVIAAMAARKQ